MQSLEYRHSRRDAGPWNRLLQRLVYLPGAFVMAYGLWLSLNA